MGIFLQIILYAHASSTTKTSRHDIAEILLKLALKHQTSINQSNITVCLLDMIWCFNANFNNISAISWRLVLVVEEATVPEKKHRSWASNW
jgi:hypothetical protein